MGTKYVISGMPAAIFVTDSHSLFTLVMAANTAHLNGKEREIFGKDGDYWMRSLFVTPNCILFIEFG